MVQPYIIYCHDDPNGKIPIKLYNLMSDYISESMTTTIKQNNDNVYAIEDLEVKSIDQKGYLILKRIMNLGFEPIIFVSTVNTDIYRYKPGYVDKKPIGNLIKGEYSFCGGRPIPYISNNDQKLLENTPNPVRWLYQLKEKEYGDLLRNNQRIDDVYSVYKKWCENNGKNIYSKDNWVVRINVLSDEIKVMDNKKKKIRIKNKYGKYEPKCIRFVSCIEREKVIKLVKAKYYKLGYD